jgi:hypothetical protein
MQGRSGSHSWKMIPKLEGTLRKCTIAKLTSKEPYSVFGKWARRMWIHLAQDMVQELINVSTVMNLGYAVA